MTWSDKQRTLFMIACGLAGWNDQQRYLAMRAAGCPCVAPAKPPKARRIKSDTDAQCPPGGMPDASPSRPSVMAPGNTHEMFAAVMSLAEASARTRGATMIKFPRPAAGKAWRDAALDTSTRLIHKAREIWREAQERMPGKFFGGDEALDAFARRVTASDAAQFPDHFMAAPQDLDACDAAQACRVVEGLRAWVGRDFYAAGINPRTFVIPHNAVAQVNAQARRHVTKRQTAVQETSP